MIKYFDYNILNNISTSLKVNIIFINIYMYIFFFKHLNNNNCYESVLYQQKLYSKKISINIIIIVCYFLVI